MLRVLRGGHELVQLPADLVQHLTGDLGPAQVHLPLAVHQVAGHLLTGLGADPGGLPLVIGVGVVPAGLSGLGQRGLTLRLQLPGEGLALFRGGFQNIIGKMK